ncbi:hypothetical protein [Streptomyces coelicoflavus]|uniref:hypothetical protein n=1 Tax=Streptomyces coelicoflavus TaxID=285562 RepID=UPI000D591BE7|nr:hypothetical protein [Streptomyces coelicoflavus]
MLRKRTDAVPELPMGARLTVPVMAATGGSGRTTVARLLGAGLASSGSTVVLDLGPRLSSPWPALLDEQKTGGLAALPPDQPLTRSAVQQACVVQHGRAVGGSNAGGATWHLLSDGQEWHTRPLNLPEDPAAWYQLAAIGGWQAVVADTVHPLAHDLLAARCAGKIGRTRGWYDLPFAVPVLCAAATAQGMRCLQQAVMVLHAEGLPLRRTVVALVATGDGRLPVAVRAGATMLASRTAAVVQVPHDPHVHAHSLAATRLRSCTRQAGAQLAGAVLTAAHTAWGRPLPGAPHPAPVAPVRLPAPAVAIAAALEAPAPLRAPAP